VDEPGHAAGPGAREESAADASETEALRRVDWRFLLDRPDLGRVVLDGPADPALAAGLSLIAEAVVRPEAGGISRDGERFDVAVLVAPSTARLASVARRAGPGAWVIAELAPPWSRMATGRRGRRAVGPRAAVRTLRQLGFDAELRWHWPSFEGALELVPLDQPATLELSVRRRRSRRARFVALPIRIAARFGWLASLLPSVAITAHRTTSAGASDERFLAAVLAAAHERFGERSAISTDRALLLTPRFPASRHVIALALDRDGRLGLIAKAPRRREDDGGLRREATALGRLASRSPAGSANGAPSIPIAPRSLGVADVCGWPVLLETALAGSPLGRPAIRANRERWVGAAGDLAGRLASAGEPTVIDDRLPRLVDGPLGNLASALPPGDPLQTIVQRTIAALGPLAAAALPTVLEHGDLAPPNLLVTGHGGLAAIDWELAEPAGLPGHDLALFLHFAAVAAAGHGTERDPGATGTAIEAAFAGPTPWAREALGQHLRAIGADPELALVLAVAAFARVTASMPARARRTPGPWLAADRHAVAWVRLLGHLA